MLKLRPVSAVDLDLTFRWASDDKLRQFSFNKGISWDEHRQWFNEKIESKSCEFYILVDRDVSVGSIRFDIEHGNTAKISYLIDSGSHGKGYGKQILKLGLELIKMKRSDILKVYGIVFKDNIASINIFNVLGFTGKIVNGLYFFELVLK